MKNLSIPACYKYIQTKDGDPDYQRIYGVALSAYQTKYPNSSIDKDEMFRYLQMSQIIPEKYDSGMINLDYVELCFTIISQFKCNSICQICAYSPLYRNAHEKEEALLLGYSMRTWPNLQRMINSGVVSRHFRAMIPVSEKSKVMVVPLNRLAFEYLERIPKSQDDMLSITDKIIRLLRQNNQNKLSPSDFKIAKHYLDNLYNGNYASIDDTLLQKYLHDAFSLSLAQARPVPDPSKTDRAESVPDITEDNKKDENKAPVHIDGLLADKNTHFHQEIRSHPDKPAPQEKRPKPATPEKQPAVEGKKEDDDDKTEQAVPHKPLITYTAAPIFLPRTQANLPWKLTKKELENRNAIDLDSVGASGQDILKEDLLLTPLLPAEIVSVDSCTSLLFLANHRLYCYDIDNPMILDLLLPYITASKYRKILCYDPHNMYEYFFKEQVFNVDISALGFYFELYESLKVYGNKPLEAISRICRENEMPFPETLNLYKQTYLSFEKLLRKDSKRVHLLHTMTGVAKIIALSEASRPEFLPGEKLVKTRTPEGYTFRYQAGDPLHGGYKAVSFHLHWEDESNFPVNDLLASFSDDIIFRKGSGLLCFDKNTAVFAVLPEHYEHLCTRINELAYEIGNKKLPVIIDEKILVG